MCQSAIEHSRNRDAWGMDALFEKLPALETRINEYLVDENFNIGEPKETCVRMQLCTEYDIFELLVEEQPLDLNAHIWKVNSDPNANWVAGVNEKFEGASLKEVKSIMGTVVDPDWVI